MFSKAVSVSIFAKTFIFSLFWLARNSLSSNMLSLEFVRDAAIICVQYSNHRKMSFFSLSHKKGISASNFGKKTLSYCIISHHWVTSQTIKSSLISFAFIFTQLCSKTISWFDFNSERKVASTKILSSCSCAYSEYSISIFCLSLTLISTTFLTLISFHLVSNIIVLLLSSFIRVSIYFLLLSSNHHHKLILKTSTMLIIFERTVSFANVGLTPAITFQK
jgi:hypothetical protein